jgi:hypothetical protein
VNTYNAELEAKANLETNTPQNSFFDYIPSYKQVFSFNSLSNLALCGLGTVCAYKSYEYYLTMDFNSMFTAARETLVNFGFSGYKTLF